MLVSFFLKNFYSRFIIFFISLIFVFSASDILVRLPLISSFRVTLKLFILMLPLMAQFALPIASCLAVQIVVGNLYLEDEIIVLNFFSKAKKALCKSVLFFSLSILCFYVPVIMTWAPKGYKNGKKQLLKLAQEHFINLKENQFHSIGGKFAFFCKNKKTIGNKLFFKNILLVFKQKNRESYIANAKSGFLKDNFLLLQDGIMQNIYADNTYFSSFQKTKIDLNKFIGSNKSIFKVKDLKFFTFNELKKIKNKNISAYVEYNKRFAQIIWQFFLPFMALFLILIFAGSKNNFPVSILLSGGLFFISYISINFMKILIKNLTLAIILPYLSLSLLLIFIIYISNKLN